MGTHSDLLKKGGKYYHLYTRQFRHQMEEAYNPLNDSPQAAIGEGGNLIDNSIMP
jgi:hypothetical protein